MKLPMGRKIVDRARPARTRHTTSVTVVHVTARSEATSAASGCAKARAMIAAGLAARAGEVIAIGAARPIIAATATTAPADASVRSAGSRFGVPLMSCWGDRIDELV